MTSRGRLWHLRLDRGLLAANIVMVVLNAACIAVSDGDTDANVFGVVVGLVAIGVLVLAIRARRAGP